MVQAKYSDKARIVEILTASFLNNQSVNYIVKQGPKREQRIKSLMSYSFDMCKIFGEVYISEDSKGCALIMLPEKKRITIKSILLDIQLIFACTGIANIKKVLAREKAITTKQGTKKMYYLWFIGVEPKNQSEGIGTKLLKEIIKNSDDLGLAVYLETSTEKNLPWYKKAGFREYASIDLSYTLHFLVNN